MGVREWGMTQISELLPSSFPLGSFTKQTAKAPLLLDLQGPPFTYLLGRFYQGFGGISQWFTLYPRLARNLG